MTKSIQLFFVLVLILALFSCTKSAEQKPIRQEFIRGWNILSDNREKALETIDRSVEYDINHLQISHRIIMDLKHVRDTARRDLANELIDYAHQKGIKEVTVWDHCLYRLDYYPDSLKINTAEGPRINLDDPDFWIWFKADYRKMLDQLPNLDGIILTFIETGAHVEDQYSIKLKTEEEKLAALVDSLATVVMHEYNLSLYLRTFIYTKQELNSILRCLDLIKNQDIITMMKEVPHDFYLTHPVNENVSKINRPVIIEFDGTHEYNGQNIIASIFPEVHMKRYRYYARFPQLAGYVVRMDRYGDTHAVNTPAEINAYAIDRISRDTSATADAIYTDFIEEFYGSQALPLITAAFQMAEEISLSTFYTLGTNSTRHSALDYEDRWIYTRHVPGRWLDPPVIHIEHGVNKEFHIWKDVINHISPPHFKTSDGLLAKESPEVMAQGWLDPEELINMEYLGYIITEKNHGVKMADSAYQLIEKARDLVPDSAAYHTLHERFYRNLLSAKARRAGAGIYYGKRLWDRGPEFQTEQLKAIMEKSVAEGQDVSSLILDYNQHLPIGQWKWRNSAYTLLDRIKKINRKE